MTNDYDLMDGAVEVEAAQSGAAKLQWGKFDIHLRRYRKGERKVDVLPADYKVAVDAGEGAKFGAEYVVTLDTEELGSQYGYTRAVNAKGPDMVHTFMPSVKRLVNMPTASTEEVFKYLASLRGQYVEVEDVPQVGFDGKQSPPNEDGKTYYAPRIVRVLSGKAEAQQLYDARWRGGAKSSNGTTATIQRPAQYSAKVWESTIIPAIKADIANGVSVAEIAAGHEIDAQYVQQFVTA